MGNIQTLWRGRKKSSLEVSYRDKPLFLIYRDWRCCFWRVFFFKWRKKSWICVILIWPLRLFLYLKWRHYFTFTLVVNYQTREHSAREFCPIIYGVHFRHCSLMSILHIIASVQLKCRVHGRRKSSHYLYCILGRMFSYDQTNYISIVCRPAHGPI